MANYLLAYRGGGMPETDAEREQVMAAWGEWFGKLGPALVDGGSPFGPSRAVAADGSVDGAAPSGLTGYSIVSADSLDTATDHARDCPILASGGAVDVYESFEVG
jgi:hypothetical protein